MWNVSRDYIKKIMSKSLSGSWSGTLRTTAGTEYAFANSDIMGSQSKIVREMCGGEALGIGNAASAELSLGLYFEDIDRHTLYGAVVRLYFTLNLDDGTETIPAGIYIVTAAKRVVSGVLLTAYDYMHKFERAYVSSVAGFPYDMLLSACSVCGVELDNTPAEIRAMPNGRISTTVYDPKGLLKTWRELVGYVAAHLAGNAVIRPDGKLRIVPFMSGVQREIPPGWRYSLTLADYVSYFTTVTMVNLRNNTVERATSGQGGLVYEIGENPLMQPVAQASRRQLLQNILSTLGSVAAYTPFSASVPLDPALEPGDVLRFTGNHGADSVSIITSLEFSLGGAMSLRGAGEDPYIAEVQQASASADSDSGSGSVGSGVVFYDYVNENAISVGDGESGVLASITYDSNGKYRNEFEAEVKVDVETTETGTGESGGGYTENDGVFTVAYFINGVEVAEYHPECTYQDGTHLLHLFYVWNSDLRVEESTLIARITAAGASVSVGRGESRARIMQTGTAYEAESDELLYIQVTRMPNKTEYYVGENLDYTGVVVEAFYVDGRSVDVTSRCTYNPANGAQVTETGYISVGVEYTEDGVTYDTEFGLDVIELLSIEVTRMPDVTEYEVGDSLDYDGLVITAHYTNGLEKDVTSSCVFDPADGETVDSDDTITVDVEYTEHGTTCTTSFDLLVMVLSHIVVTTLPDKTEYYIGEDLDYSGLVVTAYYTNGEERDVTASCVFVPDDGSTLSTIGQTTVTASYTEGSVTATDTFDVEVEAVVLTGIAVTTLPTTTTYEQYGVLDLTGIVVTATYSDGSTADVTSGCVFNPASGSVLDTAGQNVVNVSYTENGVTETTSFEVTVNAGAQGVFDLKYFIYSKDDEAKTITLTATNPNEIIADGVHQLDIPDHYQGYQICIG